MAIGIVLFGLNFGQNRPFFALQKSNLGFAFENERTVRKESYLTSQEHTQLMHERASDIAEKQSTQESLKKVRPQVAQRNMLVGALWCIGGILVTAITYKEAVSSPTGGRYFIAWGAIVFGAIQFFKGVFQSLSLDQEKIKGPGHGGTHPLA